MVQRFYANNAAAGYTPTTIRGGWDVTTQNGSSQLGTTKSGTATTVAQAVGSTADSRGVLLRRFVSDPIAYSGTLAGTLQWVLGIKESATGLDGYYKVYAFVTAGDSDTNRGTLINNEYAVGDTPGGGTEFTTTATGRGEGAASISPVAVTAGDRICIEIGYDTDGASSTTQTATLNYGGTGATDLTQGSTSVTTQPGWFEFSDDNSLFTGGGGGGGGGIALRSTSSGESASTSATTITVSKPAGVVDGDFLVAVYSLIATNVASVMSAPAGWTMGTVLAGSSTEGAAWCWKVASSEPSSYTFAAFNGGYGVVNIMAFSGVDTTTPLAPVSDSNPATWSYTAGNVAAQTSPAVSPTTSDAVVVYANVAEHSPAAATWTMPGGTTSAFQYTNSAAYFMQAAAYEQLSASGSTGTASFSASGTLAGRWGGTLALNTAATGGGSTPQAANDAAALTNVSSLSTSRSRTDAGSLSVQTSSLSTSRTRTDAAALAESASVNKKTADTASLSESKALSTSRSRADAATLGESSSVNKGTADAGALSETRTLSTSRSRTDSAAVTDSATVTKQTADVAGVTEAHGLSASSAAIDAGTLTSLAGTASSASTGDAATLGELSGVAITSPKSSGDAATVDDSSALSAAVPGSEAAGLGEGAGLAADAVAGDSAGLDESSAVDVTVYKGVDDTLTLDELSGTSATLSTGATAHLTDVATFGDGAVITGDLASLGETSLYSASSPAEDDAGLDEIASVLFDATSSDAVSLGESSDVLRGAVYINAGDGASVLDESHPPEQFYSALEDLTLGESASVQVLIATGDAVGLDDVAELGASVDVGDFGALTEDGGLLKQVSSGDGFTLGEDADVIAPAVWRHRLVATVAYLNRLVGLTPVVSGRLGGTTNQVNASATVSGRLSGSVELALLSGSAEPVLLGGTAVVEELAGTALVNELRGSASVSSRLVGTSSAGDRVNGSAGYY